MSKHYNNTKYKKIVFIDDDVDLIKNYKSILERNSLANYLIHFENAKESIQYLKSIEVSEELPDYILLDLYMPEMSGFQFLKQFDSLPKLKNEVEVYVCTSSKNKDDRNQVMKYPFVCAYIEKPLSSDFIEYLIKDQL